MLDIISQLLVPPLWMETKPTSERVTQPFWMSNSLPLLSVSTSSSQNFIFNNLISLGNGLTDPAVQYEYYPTYACENPYGPVLDQSECDQMSSKYGLCRSLIESCYKYETAFTCVPGALYCNSAMIQPFQKTGLNIYDIRKTCDPSNPLCYTVWIIIFILHL
jgi:carboxypeptidase C (cathepsin A)